MIDPAVQLVLVSLINLITIIYVSFYQPADRIFARNLELFNEFVLTIINLHMFMYTEWIMD